MSIYVHYSCAACGFGGKLPFDDDPTTVDCMQATVDACLAIEQHAAGRRKHLMMKVRVDGLKGHYVLDVNPRSMWKGESAKRAGGQ